MPTVDKQNIRLLAKIFSEVSMDDSKNTQINVLDNLIPVLKNYFEDKVDLQIEFLYAVQLLSHELEHPSGKFIEQIIII